MLLTMLQAKLHRLRVTHANLHYEGSCGIDSDLLQASGIREFQYVEIYNVNNGERFSTYVIAAPANSGELSLNGAAARKAVVGDVLIITAYMNIAASEITLSRPRIVFVDERNHIADAQPDESAIARRSDPTALW